MCTASLSCAHDLNVMPSKTIKCMRNDEKLNSTLPCGWRKVEYKFFIEVIERCYARLGATAFNSCETGIRGAGLGAFARKSLGAAS